MATLGLNLRALGGSGPPALAVAAALLVAWGGSARAQDAAPGADAAVPTRVPDDPASAADSAPPGDPPPGELDPVAAEATLNPGDGIRLLIYRQPDASGDFTVDESGHVVLPLLGAVDVRDTPLRQLKAQLVERYSAYFRTPSIQVTPVYRVNVLGEVRQPGLYPVDLTMTLPSVLALAGGVTPTGSLEKVAVLRAGRELRSDLTDPKVATRPVAEFGLRSGDQIVVGEKGRGFWQAAPVIAGVVTAGVAVLLAVAN
jgi:polysaccharide export outer membrane protein